VTRKSIATNMAVVSCDVCGRTLLRGENADVFLHGGAARTLLGRLRQRRQDREPQAEPVAAAGPVADGTPVYDPATYDPAYYDPAAVAGPAPVAEPQPAAGRAAPARRAQAEPVYEPPREPRTVRAIPTNDELKVARALTVFNASGHPRTVAGVARSLGSPMVCARPSRTEGSVVSIVVGWELSWYRYEVDLGDEASGVRVVAQGSELTELPPEDADGNAAADEYGELHPLAGVA
jgi:hypothetical protein